MVQLKCDCMERIDTDINSLKLFEEMKSFCHNQVANGVFIEIPVSKPYHTGYSTLEQKELKWYATKWYQCQSCGCIWEFLYPDFPAKGFIRTIK